MSKKERSIAEMTGSKHNYVHRGITKLSKQAQKIHPKNWFLVPSLSFLFYLQQCESSLCTTLENNLIFSYTFLHLRYKTVLSPQRHGSWSVCACGGRHVILFSIHFPHRHLTLILRLWIHFMNAVFLLNQKNIHRVVLCFIPFAVWSNSVCFNFLKAQTHHVMSSSGIL